MEYRGPNAWHVEFRCSIATTTRHILTLQPENQRSFCPRSLELTDDKNAHRRDLDFPLGAQVPALTVRGTLPMRGSHHDTTVIDHAMYARDERVVIGFNRRPDRRQCTSDEPTGPMKADAAGIAGKRGARIPIPRQPEAPKSDSQRRLGSHPRASGPHAPEGAKVLCGTQKKMCSVLLSNGGVCSFLAHSEVMIFFC